MVKADTAVRYACSIGFFSKQTIIPEKISYFQLQNVPSFIVIIFNFYPKLHKHLCRGVIVRGQLNISMVGARRASPNRGTARRAPTSGL